jgi:predicted extracellular nuclease
VFLEGQVFRFVLSDERAKMSTRILGILVTLVTLAGGTVKAAGIHITEWAYGGSEYIEFTNTGLTPIDLTGWKFADDSLATTDLSAFGIVAAGESVILAEEDESSFRARWNLDLAVKIIGSNGVNLGREDAIFLLDSSNAIIDSLDFGDQIDFPGTIRTNNVSGNPNSDLVLGTNNVAAWSLSFVGDKFGSYTSATGGFIGNPGSYPTAVPEPSSLVLLSSAFGMSVLVRRKRASARS